MHSCVLGGIRNSEFFPLFLGESEIPNAFLSSWGEQKSLIFSYVLGEIRNSEFLPVLMGE